MYFYLNLVSYLKHNLRMSGSTGVMGRGRGLPSTRMCPGLALYVHTVVITFYYKLYPLNEISTFVHSKRLDKQF